jgi:hypothetical protein
MADEQNGRLKGIENRLDSLEGWAKAFEDRLLQFLAREFESVRQGHDRLVRQVGFLHEVTAALVKNSQANDRDSQETKVIQAGQQRAIDELFRRVQRLEQERRSGPPAS